MLSLSFSTKLMAAMVLVVVGVTGATLYVSQQKFHEEQGKLFSKLFRLQNESFTQKQGLLVDNIKRTCTTLVGSPRLQLALPEATSGDTESLYQQAKVELQARRLLATEAADSNAFYLTFFLFFDASGKILSPPADALPALKPFGSQSSLKKQLAQAGQAIPQMDQPIVGYVTPETDAGQLKLQQVVVTKVIDTPTGDALGALALGFPMPDLAEKEQFKAGILLESRIFSQSIPESLRNDFAKRVAEQISLSALPPENFIESIDGNPHRVFYEALNPDPHLPKAYLVALISMRELLDAQRELRGRIFLFGGVGLLAALLVSRLLSHGLSVPIRELVAGTAEIQRGNFTVKVPVRSRDEIGMLAGSFNEMAEGLALKEKYRSVLNMVADKEVAQELIQGSVALGGEIRDISVLFCDIRGFTPLTQDMDPAEVIQMLNEHMTALTRVVYEHHGVVDKFVGDLIMAIFGAPKSYDNDAANAARCALEMIHRRHDLNATSKHQITIGIGVTSGPAVAGCMGSTDRLNYTVLGERVNLASRLCGKAARMEVVIDQTTCQRLGEAARVEPLPELELKGFSGRVQAFKLLDIRLPQPRL